MYFRMAYVFKLNHSSVSNLCMEIRLYFTIYIIDWKLRFNGNNLVWFHMAFSIINVIPCVFLLYTIAGGDHKQRDQE